MNDVVDGYELSPMQHGTLFHALSAPGAYTARGVTHA
jgi:hypothetical protein